MAFRGRLARRPVHLTAKEILVRIGSRRWATGSCPPGLDLGPHCFVFAFRDRQFVPLYGDLPLQDSDPLAMPRGKPLRDLDRLGIADSSRQAAPPLGVVQVLPLPGELPLGGDKPIPHCAEADLGVEKRGVHQLRTLPRIGWRRVLGQEALQAGTQRFKHPQDFRTVLA